MLKILYVEDCQADAKLLELCIERYATDTDVSISVVATVSEARKEFDAGKFDAALIDWNLPDGAGTDVARHIRNTHSLLPIIFFSGLFAERHLSDAEKYTPKACLTKDYSEKQIQEIIHKIRVPK